MDALAHLYPDRKLSLSKETARLEFYSSDERPNAFAFDSLEFFLIISQYFREALPLRLIFLMIACQKAGGQILLTQEEMATVLDVPRQKVSTSLNRDIIDNGIAFRVRRGVYQFNPPYSYRVGELIPQEDGTVDYVRVEQHDVLAEVRNDKNLPDLVRFPSLDHLRKAVEDMRAERAKKRAERRARFEERTGQ